jgi:adenylate cyclase
MPASRPKKRIDFRVGIHLGDVVEESDGDLMGDGVNIAARLEGIAPPGAICLSEAAYWQVKSRLDLAVTDLGPTQLKNIAERIRVYLLQVGVPAQARSAKPSGQNKRLAAMLLGVALLLVLAAGGYWLAANRPAAIAINPPAPVASNPAASGEAKHLSIVVMPFTNLSGDPAQDYFADGITENLTTDLSRIRNSFVIARNTAFTYKGKKVDAKEIGKELGVRTCSKARCSATEPACASTPSSSTPKPARISGLTGSKRMWPTYSSCRMKLWRDWAAASISL